MLRKRNPNPKALSHGPCESEIVDAPSDELLTQKESQFVTLFVLLISADLRVLDTHWNLEVTRKFKMRIENKRHTSAYQPLTSFSTR
jgi:hypothetical protein